MTQTRRDFVKRSAAAGGVIWATPAISTVSRAWAQEGSPVCPDEACPGRAFGASLTAPVVGTITLAETFGGPTQVLATPPPLAASVIGADVGGPPCFATAHADQLTVTAVPGLVIQQGTLTSAVQANQDCTATMSSRIANVFVNGQLLDAQASPNTTLVVNLGLVGTLTVIVNEQGTRCVNGTQTYFVNALHVTLVALGGTLPTTELIVAHAEVGSTCCPC